MRKSAVVALALVFTSTAFADDSTGSLQPVKLSARTLQAVSVMVKASNLEAVNDFREWTGEITGVSRVDGGVASGDGAFSQYTITAKSLPGAAVPAFQLIITEVRWASEGRPTEYTAWFGPMGE